MHDSTLSRKRRFGPRPILGMAVGAAVVAVLGWQALSLGFGSPARAQRAPEALNPTVDEYTVQPGDTFWGICEEVVGKGAAWPQIWAYNPEITNPNWLYAGDIIRFYAPAAPLPAADATTLAAATSTATHEIGSTDKSTVDADDESTGGPLVEVVRTIPPPTVAKQNRARRAYVGLFITSEELEASGILSNAVPDKILLTQGDDVYVTFPSTANVSPGDRFLVYRTLRPIEHPTSGNSAGYLTQMTGFLTVVARHNDEVVRAHIDEAMFELERGQKVRPLEASLMVNVQPLELKQGIEGVVLAVGDLASDVAGEQDLVYVDKGEDDGLKRGHRLGVFSRGDPLTDSHEDLPGIQTATLLVIEAKQHASTCLVVDARSEVNAGDPVRGVLGALPPEGH